MVSSAPETGIVNGIATSATAPASFARHPNFMETSLFSDLWSECNDAASFAVLLRLCRPNHQRNEVPGQEAANADAECFRKALPAQALGAFLYTSAPISGLP